MPDTGTFQAHVIANHVKIQTDTNKMFIESRNVMMKNKNSKTFIICIWRLKFVNGNENPYKEMATFNIISIKIIKNSAPVKHL